MPDATMPVNNIVDYMRLIGIFEGNPVDELRVIMNQEEVPVLKQVDLHQTHFDALENKLSRTSGNDVLDDLRKNIPNDAVIIEFGTHFGMYGSYIAEGKPRVQVIAVQMPIPDHLTRRVPEFLFKEPVNIKRRVLRDGVGFLTENWADMEKYEVITRLYNQNGLRNISYHTMRIDPAELKKGILPHFLEEVGNRPTYIISFDAEKQWPFVLARLYKTMQSKGLDVSMADQGRTDPINFSWDVVDCYLELTGTDRTNFFKCAQDDSSVNHPGEWDLPEGSEHGRDIHGFPRIGRAIKLGMADALAKYVQGGVMKNTNPNQRKWADPTYFVRARGL